MSGKTFIGSGWYADGNDEHTWRKNLSNMATAIAMQAKIGDNQVMPYGLSSHFSATEQRAFMDEMQRSFGTLGTTPLLLNLMVSEYVRNEAKDSAIQFDGARRAVLASSRATLEGLQ